MLPPGDSTVGYRIGGVVLLAIAVVNVLAAAGYESWYGVFVPKMPLSQDLIAFIFTLVVGTIAFSLLVGSNWARRAALVVVTIHSVVLGGTVYVNYSASSGVWHYAWATAVLAFLLPVAWSVLLRRPTTGTRIIVGTGMVLGVYAVLASLLLKLLRIV